MLSMFSLLFLAASWLMKLIVEIKFWNMNGIAIVMIWKFMDNVIICCF